MTFASRFRLALLMTIAVYPVVVGYSFLIGLVTPGWDLWQRGFILVPLMASTIVFLIVPFVTTRFAGFIAGRRPAVEQSR